MMTLEYNYECKVFWLSLGFKLIMSRQEGQCFSETLRAPFRV